MNKININNKIFQFILDAISKNDPHPLLEFMDIELNFSESQILQIKNKIPDDPEIGVRDFLQKYRLPLTKALSFDLDKLLKHMEETSDYDQDSIQQSLKESHESITGCVASVLEAE